MTSRYADALESSWRHAEPIADTVIRLFYRRLFQSVPELRGRFCTSMCEQGDHLREATQDLVRRFGGDCDSPAEACDEASDSGSAREHESTVVDAWLWALEQEIGSCAVEGARGAWREAIRSEAGAEFRQVAVGELALVAG